MFQGRKATTTPYSQSKIPNSWKLGWSWSKITNILLEGESVLRMYSRMTIANTVGRSIWKFLNPMDGGAWWAAVHGVHRRWTRLSDFTFTFHFHALEKELATHSSVLAWRIPGKGETGRLPSMGSHRVRHDWSDLAAAAAAREWIWKVLIRKGKKFFYFWCLYMMIKINFFCNHFVIYVTEVIMLHIFNLYSAVCQPYIDKTKRRESFSWGKKARLRWLHWWILINTYRQSKLFQKM